MSLQVCGCCGWSKVTTYHGLRTHQGKKGCTPKGMSIPKSEQYRFNSYSPSILGPPIQIEEPRLDFFAFSIKPVSDSGQNTWRSLREESPQKPFLTLLNQETPAVKETNKPLFETPQHSQQTNSKVCRALDFSSGAQQPFLTLLNQATPAVKEINKPLFETPQHSQQTNSKVFRALDFSSGAQQVESLAWAFPVTTAQETAVQQKEREMAKQKEREMAKQKEREMVKQMEKEREAQKLLKARQDRIRAHLEQKIQMREQKTAEVRSSANVYMGSLLSEWLEINNVFSEVMRVVEDARKKALQPLEERRHRIKREEQDLVQKLQTEIDKLKTIIDGLDRNPHLQVPPLDESQDWKNVTVDGSFSLGTLRSKTSNMMEQIHQKLEKLSSVELKRIPTFAVDVKLDPTTAHQCLVLSPDGKKVRDGGENQRLPDAPERFDMFGSILGINRLTSGKSYWEVEVTNKTGWDLGVARRNANRKGKLSLTPDKGFWVIVHFEDKKYAALTAPAVSLSLTVKPQKVGVFVDYEEGLVSFYDVTAQSHIYSFTGCSFSDEIFPYFSPHLKQNGKNCDPLIISAVEK